MKDPMLESSIWKKVNPFALKCGWRPHRWTRPGRRGANDFFYTKKPGRILFVEYKRDGKELEALQVIEVRELRAEGHMVQVIDSVDAGYCVFRNV